jgi:hypothetical protein
MDKQELKSALKAKTLVLLSGILFTFGLVSSCTMSESGMKRSIGAVNELLVVTNDKVQWQNDLGDSIRAFFGAEQPGLPQAEPIFDMVNVADEHFNELFQKYHNIFIVDIDPEAGKTFSETKENIWSEPQRVIKIVAPDKEAFYQEFNLKKETYLELFITIERKRSLEINKMSVNTDLTQDVERKFGIFLPIPGGFYKAKEAGDFMWIRHKMTKAKQDVELSMMIYTMDYRDTIVFDPRHIMQWRNTITLEHIPGPSPLSFMKIHTREKPPVFDTISDFPGGFAVETRGLWEVENDFMGGAFINYTFVDTASHKVITLDGYVYNPNELKKNYIRQLEAIFFATVFFRKD